ncbi:MAG: alpha/beta fold hydrolase BchO [Pseudomonadota bacterium]
MGDRLRWEEHRHQWPHADKSRFVHAGGMRWHAQVGGDAERVALLVHGTGSSAHSWRHLIDPLCERFTVVAPDLPGHGFSSPPSCGADAMSLPTMARALGELMRRLDLLHARRPLLLVGHSAGAALLIRACLDGQLSGNDIRLLGLCSAVMPFPGVAGHLLKPIARGLARVAIVAPVFALRVRSDRSVIRQLLRQTGSSLDAKGVDHYRTLAGNAEHVRSALDMMAAWDLHSLARDLCRLRTPATLVAAELDGTIPARHAYAAAALIPDAIATTLTGVGHLAHEEAPDRILEVLSQNGW